MDTLTSVVRVNTQKPARPQPLSNPQSHQYGQQTAQNGKSEDTSIFGDDAYFGHPSPYRAWNDSTAQLDDLFLGYWSEIHGSRHGAVHNIDLTSPVQDTLGTPDNSELGSYVDAQHAHEVDQNAKLEKRRAQNRESQRNFRMRKQAAVDRLLAKIESQSREIEMLRQYNQFLGDTIKTYRIAGINGRLFDGHQEWK
ncbi:hypothetical protein AYL99_11898 [Fonsecaea erecta]|uniref:BZIP domain-containing protein n=1 Tax=Fonsecaea erecta TaxID=1367422 RepID=A0A178Z379_9EURO|nr:hypothetical protein AYL99_11898 [Fonsecaea erecta]OAP53876.1 hypothetical protein AYL99_11898 [Fonsecaea erecta]